MFKIICVGIIGGSIVAISLVEDKLISKGKFVESDTIRGIIVGVLTVAGIGTSFLLIREVVRRFLGV